MELDENYAFLTALRKFYLAIEHARDHAKEIYKEHPSLELQLFIEEKDKELRELEDKIKEYGVKCFKLKLE